MPRYGERLLRRALPTVLLVAIACAPGRDRRTPEVRGSERTGLATTDSGHRREGDPTRGRDSATARRPMNPWPFEDSENVAVFTTRQVVNGREPILAVFHDAEDGAWQFISAAGANEADLMIVSLRQVFDIDPSIAELADLPPGWEASRRAPGQPWQRQARE